MEFNNNEDKSSLIDENDKEQKSCGAESAEYLIELVSRLCKDSTVITLKRGSKSSIDVSNLNSNFGGLPYFEKGESWPQSPDGEYLEFVFQIFNEDGIFLPESIKLVQFFYDFDKMPWDTESDGWLVKIYEDINMNDMKVIEKPAACNNIGYCIIEYYNQKSLPDWDGLDSYCLEAQRLSGALNGEAPWACYEKIASRLTMLKEGESLSHLGGYPNWIQGSEEIDVNKYSLLFQINSEDTAGLMWGDSGTVYVFYDAENKKTEFILQCY